MVILKKYQGGLIERRLKQGDLFPLFLFVPRNNKIGQKSPQYNNKRNKSRNRLNNRLFLTLKAND